MAELSSKLGSQLHRWQLPEPQECSCDTYLTHSRSQLGSLWAPGTMLGPQFQWGTERHGFSPLSRRETDVLLFTPENGVTAEILNRGWRSRCRRDQASDNTNCNGNRHPYTLALQPQYGICSGPGKSQRPSSEQGSQQNNMDHTREGLGGQAWKQPPFPKPA